MTTTAAAMRGPKFPATPGGERMCDIYQQKQISSDISLKKIKKI